MGAVRRATAAAVPAAAAFAAACLSVPAYQPAPLVSYRDDATGSTISGSGFELHLAGGSDFHFPDALSIDHTDVMGHDPAAACWGQDGTGFAVVPTPRISADGTAPPVTNQLTAVLRGPAVVQVALEWTTRFSCGRNRAPGGSSTFTVFPDGRIVRHDRLDDPDPDKEQIAAAACACPDAPPLKDAFIVSSYWTFARDRFTRLSGLTAGNRDPTNPDMLDSSPGKITANYPTMCFDGGGYQVASAWIVPPGQGSSAAPGPVTFGYAALFSHDLQKPSAPMLDFRWDIHGALFVEHAGCATAFRRALDYAQPAQLTIGSVAAAASPLDGIYGGDAGDGRTGIDVAGGRTTITGATRQPFAVWLRFPQAIGLPHATRAGATGAWYVPQRIDDQIWIVWFRDPLADGETIVIEPD